MVHNHLLPPSERKSILIHVRKANKKVDDTPKGPGRPKLVDEAVRMTAVLDAKVVAWLRARYPEETASGALRSLVMGCYRRRKR